MKRHVLSLAAVAALGLACSGAWADTVVNSFAADTSTPGVWGATDVRPGGTASIVTAPAGGPLPTGAAMLTTDSTNAAKAEVGVSNNYGLASSIISTINLSYSYYKAAIAGGADAPAPSIKLSFLNSTYGAVAGNDGFVTLIYEPYYQPVGSPADPLKDTWISSGTIDATTGQFWENGGFGQPNQVGGSYAGNDTLAGWLAAFNLTSGGAFGGATLVGVQVGVGTYNPSETDYFDKVSISGTSADATYDFETAAAVPLPKSAWGGLALIGGLGLMTGAKRLRRQEV